MARFGCVLVLAVLGSALGVSPATAAPGSTDPTNVVASVQGLNAAVSWIDGDTAGVTGYVVSASPQLTSVSVPPGADSAVLTGLRPGVPYTVSVAALTGAGAGTSINAASPVQVQAPGGTLTALKPARLLDTRSGLGAPQGATTSVTLQVTGRGGVPSSGVAAVALNVTVTGPVGGGYVTAYPAGASRPTASSMNFSAHQTLASLVVAQLGSGGAVVLYSSTTTQLVADVSGYYSTPAAASTVAASSTGLFHSLAPSRLLDTRSSVGGAEPGPGGSVTLQVAGRGGVPATGVSAVVLNTTVTTPTADGYVTVYPTGGTLPDTSSVNFVQGQTVANRVVVLLGSGGQVSLFNKAGRAQLIADVAGWYTDGSDPSAGGSYYVATAPHRLVDTRVGTGAVKQPVAASGVLPVQVAGQAALPAADAAMPPTAAALTVTMITPPQANFATVYPSLTARPATSDVNASANATTANLTLAGLGVDGAVDVYNASSATNYVIDLNGYFIGGIDVPSSTVVPAAGAITAVSGAPGANQSVTIAAGSTPPNVGQIITSGSTAATPDGLLAQVTGTSTDANGNIIAQTQPATLQQALGIADITLAAPLGADDVATVQTSPGSPAAATGHTGALAVRQLQARAVAGTVPGGPITGTTHNPCTGDSSSHVDTQHSITPTLYFHADLGHRGLIPTLSASIGAQISETLGASVQFNGTATCQWDTRLDTYTFKPITFFVGDVPVVIVPVFTLTLKATINGTASISTSLTQNITANAGLSFDSTTGTASPYQSITNTISHTGPSVSPAVGTADVALVGDLQGKLYNVAGPDVALTADLTGTVNPANTPWWRLGFTLDADVALHMQVLFLHADAEVKIHLLNLTIAQSTTPPPLTRTVILQGVAVPPLHGTTPPKATATIDCRGVIALDINTSGVPIDSMWLSVNGGALIGYPHNTSHISLSEVRGTVALGVLVYNNQGDGSTDEWRFTEVYAVPSGC
ncbi:beta strand repeat-containing protein [Streptacidiphilus sp. MAP12-16]|uniref:beta strand repeat-containing protein n=1 Tax=Streptacidiphilus sp. MAP12-16 TaxID=3156300 RepID=UPI0035157E4E